MLNEEVKYGGFWVRLLASIIDDIIISLIVAISSFIISILIVSFDSQSPLAVYLFAFFNGALWGIIIGVIYTVKLVASEKQSTFAMRLFNIIIVNKNMQRLSVKHSFGRLLALCFVTIFTLGLGFLTIVFREDKRGLHDIIAGTYVIYK